jgi:hypothetical protein
MLTVHNIDNIAPKNQKRRYHINQGSNFIDTGNNLTNEAL